MMWEGRMEDLSELSREIGRTAKSDESGGLRRVAVIGFGTMGQGITEVIAKAGLDVDVIENSAEGLQQKLQNLEAGLDAEIRRWGITKSEKRALLSRVHGTTDLTVATDADLVIEAINEDLPMKRALFQKLDKICRENTIFITNTGSLSITEIAAATKRQDRIIGMHFLNPVPKIPLVELVRGLKTSDATMARIQSFADLIGKTAVEVYEYPGFVTTRVIVPMLNEAMHVLMEGVATAEGIDTAMQKGFNLPVGPLALADQMGLDLVLQWMSTLFRELGEPQFRPCPLLRKMVRDGQLGRKTGCGFFTYEQTNGDKHVEGEGKS
jgi:3-hydroxybutyryl-CoA dehydrogenase